jgi:hypothetical protein
MGIFDIFKKKRLGEEGENITYHDNGQKMEMFNIKNGQL